MSVKVADLELAANEQPVSVSGERWWVRYLVRLHRTPLGYLDVPPERAVDVDALRRDALFRLGAEAWRALVARRLTGAPTAPAEPPRVTVVVCTRDRPLQLEGCLEALAAQDYEAFEILVVDNGSREPATGIVAERFGARHVVEPRRGLDRARNRGLLEASAPIVAYTDDDARPDPDWLSALVAGFRTPGVRAVTGLVVPAELDSWAQRVFEDDYGGMGKGFAPALLGDTGDLRPERFGVGCNMAFHRATLVALGGFDPALDVGTPTGGGGDLDAFQRLAEAGCIVAYRPDAVVRHSHRRRGRALARQLFDNGRGYSAALTAAFLRARGRERLRAVLRYARWLSEWHAKRIARTVVRRSRFPLRLLLAELVGAGVGPILYAVARRRG